MQDKALAQIGKQIAVCEAKTVFKTRGDALRFADKHPWQSREYRCPICGDWHLTSKL